MIRFSLSPKLYPSYEELCKEIAHAASLLVDNRKVFESVEKNLGNRAPTEGTMDDRDDTIRCRETEDKLHQHLGELLGMLRAAQMRSAPFNEEGMASTDKLEWSDVEGHFLAEKFAGQRIGPGAARPW